MRGRRILGILVLAVLLAAGAARAPGAVPISGIECEPGRGISIELTGYYDGQPRSGYLPLRVRIRNDSAGGHQWTFRFVSRAAAQLSHRQEYVWRASAGAGEEKTFEVVVPLDAIGDVSHFVASPLRVTVSGYGIRRPAAVYPLNQKYSTRSRTPFVGISTPLAVTAWGPLENELTGRGYELTGCRYEPDLLSSDWRAYLGFASFWLSDADWDRVPAAQRAAILEWVVHGGRLILCVGRLPDDAALVRRGLPPGPGNRRACGLGMVELFPLAGTGLDPARAADEVLRDEQLAHAHQLTTGYSQNWHLRDRVPDTQLHPGVLIAAMIGFALLVGPVNLVVFAGKRRRHRLFVTTPLISIAASLAVVALILVQDGMGGEGARAALKYLLPEAYKELLIQEQVARTGLITSSRFDLAPDAYLAWINLVAPAQERTARTLVRTEAAAEGGWFSSRAVQAHYLARITPSRARIELLNPAAAAAGEEAPVLLSTLDQPLRDVFFIDGHGEGWSAPLLPVGVRTPLEPAPSFESRREWWTRNVTAPGLRLGGLGDRAGFRPGHVYGVAEDPEAGLVDTHRGIRWKHQHLVVAGPAVTAGAGG